MGCDFCVYVPATEDKDCGMAYSTFGRVRTSIIALYLEKMGKVVDLSDGEDFNLMMNVVSQSLVDKVSKALDELKTEEADAMKVLWEHSDCDGSYWTEDCENIAKGIKKIVTNGYYSYSVISCGIPLTHSCGTQRFASSSAFWQSGRMSSTMLFGVMDHLAASGS